jgi:cysteine desulfurase
MHRWLGAADPGRVHTEGRMARAALEEAREQVAELVGARPREVVFTSGATEAINAAVFGATFGRRADVVCPAVEHSAVRDSSERATADCGRVLWVPVDGHGRVDVAAVADALEGLDAGDGRRPSLVHCQWANHEVGTMQPVAKVVARCREAGVLVHVDAAAAAGHVPIDFAGVGADLMSVSAHKFGGPPGAGALLVRRGLRLPPLLVGGEQERARRAGLENLPAWAGFGAAAADVDVGGEARCAEALIARARSAALAVPGVVELGPPPGSGRLPHLLCLSVGGVEAEAVLLGLDQGGVAAHSGSACSSESLEPSPVLQAMGVDADHSLRVSVGWSTTDADIDRFVRVFPDVVARLRALRA